MISLLFSKAAYLKRRSALAAHLTAHQDLIVYFTGGEKIRNYDTSYRFRPDSSFYYLTGLAEPEAVLLLWKEKVGKKERVQSHLLVLPKDQAREQWDGYRWGVEGAKKEFGPDFCSDVTQFEKVLLEWLKNVPLPGQAPRIYSNSAAHAESKIQLERALEKFQPIHRAGKKPIQALGNARPWVEELRLIKDDQEISEMREASKINVAAHLKVMHEIKPGMYEYELQSVCETEYRKSGCLDLAYNSICAGGANATILHYNENSSKLKKGDLFLIDAGCERHFFASDITRTIPVSGKYTKEQRQIMDIVADAHKAVVDSAVPGLPYLKMHELAEEVLIAGLKKLGFLKGSAEAIRAKNKHKRYYPHGTGHWLGHDVHDPCPYIDDKGESLKLREGMIFTVEPGLYFLKDDESVPPRYRGIGVRIEDDILVTKKGNEVLTAGLPRYAAEIEEEMRQA